MHDLLPSSELPSTVMTMFVLWFLMPVKITDDCLRWVLVE